MGFRHSTNTAGLVSPYLQYGTRLFSPEHSLVYDTELAEEVMSPVVARNTVSCHNTELTDDSSFVIEWIWQGGCLMRPSAFVWRAV